MDISDIKFLPNETVKLLIEFQQKQEQAMYMSWWINSVVKNTTVSSRAKYILDIIYNLSLSLGYNTKKNSIYLNYENFNLEVFLTKTVLIGKDRKFKITFNKQKEGSLRTYLKKHKLI